MDKIYIGIDPGKKGFISLLKNGEDYFFPMPTHKVETGEFTKKGKPKMKEVFHEEGFLLLGETLKSVCDGYKVYCLIERVIGRNGWAAEKNFNFGYVAGMQKMLMINVGAKILMVRPIKWQTHIWNAHNIEKIKVPSSTGKTMVNDTKAMSIIAAKKIAPEIDFRKTTRAKNDDDNKTDSFLIRKFLQEIINKYGEEKVYSRQDK